MTEDTSGLKSQPSKTRRRLLWIARLTLWASCFPAPIAFASLGARSYSMGPTIFLTLIYFVLAGLLDFHLMQTRGRKINSGILRHTICFFFIMVILVPVVLFGACLALLSLAH
jgi:hypothetical protein